MMFNIGLCLHSYILFIYQIFSDSTKIILNLDGPSIERIFYFLLFLSISTFSSKEALILEKR
jgi:hypothetical protein